jgi:hypothetical protein
MNELDQALPPFVHPSRWLFEDGWSYCEDPWPDILEERNLGSSDPWRRFLFVLERAKRGDLRFVDRLWPLLHATTDFRLKQASFLVLGAAGTTEALAELDRYLLDEHGTWRDLAVDAVEYSGDLRFVDALLDAHRMAFGECARAGVDDALVSLLSNEVVWSDEELERRRPDEAIRREARELHATFGRVAFWHGRPLDARAIAADAKAVLTRPAEELAECEALLQAKLLRLETLTGVARSPIAGADGPMDDRGVAAIEARIAASVTVAEQRALRPGCRAFFGHEVS